MRGVLLFDHRLNDGSRNFADLPESYDPVAPQWHTLRAHVGSLPGAVLTAFVTDDVTEAWIEFSFGGHAFSLNNQQSSWWLIVEDPACSEATLEAVYVHFESLLAPRAACARRFGAIASGAFRVIVAVGTGPARHRDFASSVEAKQYAQDCAWETEDGPVYAYVVDERFAELR